MNIIKSAALSFIFITGFVACKDPSNTDNPLTGTKWKLTGFVDAVADTIKIAEPVHDMCYLLIFNEDYTFSGVSSTNTLSGNYEIDCTAKNISLTIVFMTEVNEFFDGRLYLKSLHNVQSFSLQGNELKLYYNNSENYLLFKSQ